MPSLESPRRGRLARVDSSTVPRVALLGLVIWFVVLTWWAARVELDASRFYDERFSAANVISALDSGWTVRDNGWYPVLSFLPQAAAIAVGRSVFGIEIERPNGDLSATGYLVARSVSIAWGALALLLTYLIGCRLWSRQIALLGTVLLAMTPWMLQVSIAFKPDSAVMALMLLAFYGSLRAVESQAWGSYVTAGALIGVSLAAKWNGALIAIPLMIATVSTDWRKPVQWLRLTAAGAASLLTFALLHPNLAFYWNFFQRAHRFHNVQEETFLGMLRAQVGFLLGGGFHGRLVAVLALAGVAALLVEAFRTAPSVRRTRLFMFAGFPVLYLTLYAVLSSYPKNNNVTPVLPFTALAAAVLVERLWQRVDRRLPVPWQPWLYAVAVAAVVLGPAVRAHRYAYRQGVPTTTLEEALRLAQDGMRFSDHRVLVFDRTVDDGLRDDRARVSDRSRPGILEVEGLTSTQAEVLDLADAEVFLSQALEGPEATFYLGRVARLVDEPIRVGPRAFRIRGPELTLLIHPWRNRRKRVPMPLERVGPNGSLVFSGTPAEPLRPGEVISVDVAVLHWENEPAVEIDGVERFVFPTRKTGKYRFFATDRIRVEVAAPRVRVELEREPGEADLPVVSVWRWGRSRRVVRPTAN